MVCGPNSLEGTCAKASRRQSKKFTEHIDAPIHLLQKIYQILYCIHQILKGTLVNILLASRAKTSDILKTLGQPPHPRNLEFCHGRKWASVFCHPANWFRSIAIMKRCPAGRMPILNFPIHFLISPTINHMDVPFYPCASA